MIAKRFCDDCKYYDCDYEYDYDIHDEVKIEHCEIWSDNLMDAKNCPYYEKAEVPFYHEEDTECDKCEYLSECPHTIDCTTFADARRHVMRGAIPYGKCRKEQENDKNDNSKSNRMAAVVQKDL